MITQPAVRQRLLSLPPEQREQLALQLMGMSQGGDKMIASEIMDVTQGSVEECMQQYDAELLIHGHTHRCAVHEFQVGERPVRRIVLADWHEDKGSVLVSMDGQMDFEILN